MMMDEELGYLHTPLPNKHVIQMQNYPFLTHPNRYQRNQFTKHAITKPYFKLRVKKESDESPESRVVKKLRSSWDIGWAVDTGLFDKNGEDDKKEEGDSEKDSRELSSQVDFVGCSKLFKDMGKDTVKSMDLQSDTVDVDLLDLYNNMITNNQTHSVTLNVSRVPYLIPRNTEFFLGDMSLFGKALEGRDNSFDIIIMDPPWPNKSVHRKNAYDTVFDIYDLFSLPVPKWISQHDGIIAVWCTNKEKCIRFVRDKLLPDWGFEVVGVWHWCKVTTRCEWVFDPETPNRKPYEPIFIGRVKGKKESSGILPNEKLIVSSPMGGHSRKPVLVDLLTPFVETKNARVLEVFARNLIPGRVMEGVEGEGNNTNSVGYSVTSLGNESILFNEASLFDSA